MMVDATGIEPVTPAMSRQCSTAELRVQVDNFGIYTRPKKFIEPMHVEKLYAPFGFFDSDPYDVNVVDRCRSRLFNTSKPCFQAVGVICSRSTRFAEPATPTKKRFTA